MKGVIFNAVEDAVERVLGPEAWDDTLERAETTGSYTSLGNYSDAELVRIVESLPQQVGATLDERLRWVGINAVPYLVAGFPQFFDDVDVRGFLPALNHMIHPEVRKLYPGATPPDFDIRDDGGDEISLRYASERKLCWLAEGFTLGVADHLGESISIDQPACMHDGAGHCDLRIRFAP